MENFKHSKDAKKLKGFDKKFYDAVVDVATIVCDGTGATPGDIKLSFEGKANILTINARIDRALSSLSNIQITRYANTVLKHFAAFFSPAHHRVYAMVEATIRHSDGDVDYVEILGLYGGGV